MAYTERNKKLAVYNLISVALVIGVNYLSQTLRLNGTTIGEMSTKYANLFTPASYAFSIWGLIFLSLLAYAIFQVRRVYFTSKPTVFISQTGYWFVLANVLNCCWVFAFVYDIIGLSVLLMLGILVCLIKIIVKTNMERWDAPFHIIAFVWWPICLYCGWITVATIANIGTFLTKMGWQGGPLSPDFWTILLIVVAACLNIFMVLARNMREFAAVGVWALIAIFIRHQHAHHAIAYTALIIAIVVFAVIVWHGYKNRNTNPFKKAING